MSGKRTKSSLERGLCECGNLTEKLGTNKNGVALWGKVCRTCRGRYRYGIIKETVCQECNFVPEVSAQLEIDHIDGDRDNNAPSNLKTLCCNCHALKSYNERNIRFPAQENPFYNKKHSKETLAKIRKARKEQDLKRTT